MLQRTASTFRTQSRISRIIGVRFNSSLKDDAQKAVNGIKEQYDKAKDAANEKAEELKKSAQESAKSLAKQFSQEKTINAQVLNKYKKQLEQKAKDLGVSDLNELKEKFKDKIEKTKIELGAEDPLKQVLEWEKQQKEKSTDGSVINVRKIDEKKEKLPFKVLNDFIDVDKAKGLPVDDIKMIWKHRFLNKERALHATLDNRQFANIYANAYRYPNFVLPLPKPHNDGYELEFVQWAFVGPNTIHCMFTTLAEYKLNKEFSRPHTTLIFHQEFSQDKDLVLMNGVSEKEGGLSMDEAQLLAVNLQRFYSGKFPQMTKLLKEFNEGSPEFNVEELIKEATSV
ncbi:Atp11 protein [Candida orthopsilosis Co 90-125]|uniref:Atp11 protein n=1 Tax=Candida orthopsilosis (strain 90-125) TaxID=1136231 RepID=H8XBI7_CANO9|nr:Atp11 protein [Candida orthopsilosis Co 90-125]CCG25175.1 Atp11 protein [Candida orthopsilosis Co 90-125]